MKKYEFTDDTILVDGALLRRIKALKNFRYVNAGDLGGYIEKEENLSHDGDAWVSDNAWVYGNAWVCDNARVYGNAWVYGDAWVCDNARVYGNATVYGDADYATVKGFGREFRATTFFRQRDKSIGVVCGCFYGTLEEFREKVKETHGDSKYAKEYLMIADLMETHFKG